MIANFTNAGYSIAITWSDGVAAMFPAIWLRDNCRCASCRHPGNGQRLYEITDIPENVRIADVARQGDGAIRITWTPDGHVSTFTEGWLADHNLAMSARKGRKPRRILWSGGIGNAMPSGDWRQMMTDPAAELAFLDAYHAHGFGLIKHAPTETETVLAIGNRLGFVRVTNYGAYFDVMSVPNPTNLAYTPIGLGVHSDNPYRDPTPGVQLLHCLVSDAPGGDTLLVDGFRAATQPAAGRSCGFRSADADPGQFPVPLERCRSRSPADADFGRRRRRYRRGSLQQPLAGLAWMRRPRWSSPGSPAYRKFAEVLHRAGRRVDFPPGAGRLCRHAE